MDKIEKWYNSPFQTKEGRNRKQFTKEFKAKVALEAAKGLKTTAKIVSEFGVHIAQTALLKRQLREGLPSLFNGRQSAAEKDREHLIEDLYKQIGELQNGYHCILL